MKKVLLINGPNLQLLGRREPDIYGTVTLDDIVAAQHALAAELGLTLTAFQSNSEGEIVSRIGAPFSDGTAGILINPAA